MPSNPNKGGHSSSGAVGPTLALMEDVVADNVYNYTSWVNLGDVEAWNIYFGHLGGANITNFRVQMASLDDGNGVITERTTGSGMAAGATSMVDYTYWKTASQRDDGMCRSIRFGHNTGGVNATIRYHLLVKTRR